MSNDFYISLIYKKVNGDISEEEAIQLAQWGNANEENAQLIQDIQLTYDDMMAKVEEDQPETPKVSTSSNNTPFEVEKQKFKISQKQWIKIVGILALIIVVGLWVVDVTQKEVPMITVAGNVSTQEVELPDASFVTLRSGSRLVYPMIFSEEKRLVHLEMGQAIFMVKEEETPFVVRTPMGDITVLGTVFDLKIGLGELYLKVIEGKVNIKSRDGRKRLDAIAGEEVILDQSTINKLRARGRSNSHFEFEETPLQDVLVQLQAVYNIEIAMDDRMLDCRFSGTFEQLELPAILKNIDKKLGSVTVLQKDGAYLIEGEGCE